MKAATQEWVDKAEGDWNSLGRESRARQKPNYDLACFLAEQCVEKYLKGRLTEAGIVFPKTHALPALLTLALPVEPSWSALLPILTGLTSYGVDYRYPGFSADRDEAKEARKNCDTVRSAVRLSLGLPA